MTDTLFDFPALRPIVHVETRTVVAVAGRDDTSSLQDQFERFHAAKIGVGMLMEVCRWQYTRSTTDQTSPFRLNNNWRSRYSRLIMEREPDLAGMFDVRELRA